MASRLDILGLALLFAMLVGSPAKSVPDSTGSFQADQYYATIWTIRDGLPQSTITAITQIDDRYLWLGSFGGLVRFDGVRFKAFTVENSPGLTTNRIVSLCPSSHGGLWVGTQHHGVYHFQDGVFEQFFGNEVPGIVWDIGETRDGLVWVRVDDKLGVIKEGKVEFPVVVGGHEDAQVASVHVGHDGTLWVSTMQHGLWRRARDNFERIDSSATKPFLRVMSDRSGRLLLISREGVGTIEYGQFRRLHDVPVFENFCATILENGDLVFSSQSGGVAIKRGTEVVLPVLADSFLQAVAGNPYVRAIYRDSDEVTWVGTASGLVRLTREPFRLVRRQMGLRGGVSRVVNAGDGEIWIWSYGVSRWDGKRLQALESDLILEHNPASMLGGSARGVWIGSPDGLYLVNEQGASLQSDGLCRGRVLEDRLGAVWFVRDGTITMQGDGAERAYPLPSPYEDARDVSLKYIARNGDVWFSVDQDLGRLRPENSGDSSEQFRMFSRDDGVPQGEVRGFAESDDGDMWITSYGGGLCHRSGDSFRCFGTDEGIPDLNLSGVISDRHKRLWINSNLGILVVSVESLLDVEAGRNDSVVCRVFWSGEAEGGTAAATEDGLMWFPTINDLVVLNPEDYLPNKVAPRVQIEEVLLQNEDRVAGRQVQAGPGDVDLRFRYTAFSSRHPEQLRFQYRLRNYDNEWTSAQNQRVATYTQVPPGDYVFEVKAANEDGVWSKSVATMPVTITPRFYQTTWFVLLGFCAVAGLLFAAHRQRVAWLQRHAKRLSREIDERRRAEAARSNLEENLREASKLEAIGRLAGGIAHDFSNVLTAILGHLSHLTNELAESDKSEGVWRRHVENINACGQRAAALTQQLLAFGRQQVLNPSVVNINEVVTLMSPMLQQLLPAGIKFEVSCCDESPCARVDKNQLEQVVMNLVLNARDSISDVGTIELKTLSIPSIEVTGERPFDGATNRHVVISVSDTGQGISDDVREKIFEPFFSTKEEGKGSGLGLATVHGIVHQSGGQILVESKAGAGTVFKVCFPQIKDVARSPKASSDVGQMASRKGETILICDDNDGVRHVIKRSLANQGFQVLDSACPLDALKIAKETRSIDLLITDIVMPEQNGVVLSQQVRSIHPEIRVLMISGYSKGLPIMKGLPDKEDQFLAKPFTPSQLIERIEKVFAKDDVQHKGNYQGRQSDQTNGH